MANLRAHNPDNYEVAKKVQLLVREHGSTGPWESLGSVKNVQIEHESTPLEHFSNYLGGRAKDREEIVERRLRVTFDLEEMNVPNLKHAFGRGFRASKVGSPTKDVTHEKTITNPGVGQVIDLGVEDIKDLIVRTAKLEGGATFDAEGFAVDSTEDTADGDWNNITNPLTVVDAVSTYAGVTFAVGSIIKIENELLRVTAINGDDVTFARAQLGTAAAAHADGQDILVSAGGDYAADLAGGELLILPEGGLVGVGAPASIHFTFEKEMDVEEFEMFDGQPIRCELKFQYGAAGQVEKVLGPCDNAYLRNAGPIVIGDGSDWQTIPMVAEVTVEANGSFGTMGAIKETQS